MGLHIYVTQTTSLRLSKLSVSPFKNQDIPDDMLRTDDKLISDIKNALSASIAILFNGEERIDAYALDLYVQQLLKKKINSGSDLKLSDDPPSDLESSPSPGDKDEASRSDHVHKRPTAAEIGAASSADIDAVEAIANAAETAASDAQDSADAAQTTANAAIPKPASPVVGDFLSYIGSAWSRFATSVFVRSMLAAADDLAVRTLLSVYSQTEVDYIISLAVGGLLYKSPCRVVATSPIGTLSGYPTIDTVTILAGDANKRVLLSAEVDKTKNGPWIVGPSAWIRPTPSELQACAAFPVMQGTVPNVDSVWYLTTNDPIVPGSTDLDLSRMPLSILANQIYDATSAGKAMLTAVDLAAQKALLGIGAVLATGSTNAAARASIGIQDGPRNLPLCDYQTCGLTVAQAIGRLYYDPTLSAIAGRTLALTLVLTVAVSSGAINGTVTLLNRTDATTVATQAVTSTSDTTYSISLTVPASAKLYELQAVISSNTGYVIVSAFLRETWS